MKKQFLIKIFCLSLFLLTYHNSFNAMNENAIISVKNKNYSCTECEKSFVNKHNLTQHMHLHTGKNLFQCTLCTKQFNYNANLQRHMVIHTGDRPYACDICNKEFSQSGVLHRHMRTHIKEKPHPCSYCNKKFTDKNNRNKHILEIHVGIKPFSCDICNKEFSQNGNLQRHMVTHINEKPLKTYHSPFTKNNLLVLSETPTTNDCPLDDLLDSQIYYDSYEFKQIDEK
jgi:uncharacterized Zn-finger protein